ncbi:MAG: hypothetical protein ACYC8T_16810 [Myxococcaceae bacterium]
MPCLNADLLRVLATLHERNGDGEVSVRAGEGLRVLHFTRGHFVSSESNYKSERLGNVLAAHGKLDEALIEPLAAEAKRRGRLFGHQLLVDHLLEAGEVAQAMEQQSLLRFEHALTMEGAVVLGPKTSGQPALHRPLGALVAAVFRETLPLATIEAFLASRLSGTLHGGLTADVLGRLELHPAELRICRRLAAGEPLPSVRAAAGASDLAARIAGALVALELGVLGAAAVHKAA